MNGDERPEGTSAIDLDDSTRTMRDDGIGSYATEPATIRFPVDVIESRGRAVRKRRRWPLRMAAVAAMLALTSGAAYAYYLAVDAGNRWHERADSQEARGDGLQVELTTAEASIELLRGQVAGLNDEVDRLESRMADLANEKAQVEDQREVAEEQRDLASTVVVIANDISQNLDLCIDGLYDLINVLFDQLTYDYYDPSARTIIDSVVPHCTSAQAQSDELHRAVGG